MTMIFLCYKPYMPCPSDLQMLIQIVHRLKLLDPNTGDMIKNAVPVSIKTCFQSET